MDIKKRNSALDITRIAALFSVVGVHFFLNSGYYDMPMTGGRMLIMTVIRTGFMICVPLFIMLTGHLMIQKTWSLKYYRGIVKTLATYLLACTACLIYKRLAGSDMGIFDAILSVFNYSAAPYAWYIEMYIGLFLLIPFLNAMWRGLDSKKARGALVVTLLILTSVPSMLNIYNFSISGWFLTPSMSVDYAKLVPDYWTFVYPITYYFIGAYLREYPIKLKKLPNLLLFFASVTVFGLFSYYRSYGAPFKWGIYTDWFGFTTVIMSVFAFIFLTSRDTSSFSPSLKKWLARISDICLGAYLVSYIFDDFVYAKLRSAVPDMLDRIYYMLPTVLSVFVLSLALAAVLNLIYTGTTQLVKICAAGNNRMENNLDTALPENENIPEDANETDEAEKKKYLSVNKE